MKEIHHILTASSVQELQEKKAAFLGSNKESSVAFQRYFLSDRCQIQELTPEEGAVSYVVQPPLDGSCLALWLYLVQDGEVMYEDGVTSVCADGLTHIWSSGISAAGENSYLQTADIFRKYADMLARRGCSLSGNCARTWLFVDDIDHNYQGMVDARREFFDTCGLTSDTHYIASTGICGGSVIDGAVVQMDAYAIKGGFSHSYLYASSNMNRTSEYGVTFERGVKLDYSGCSHVLISGTASIDDNGQVVHVGDVKAQTGRMLDNVGALLSEGKCGWSDLKMAIVYLRNRDDYSEVATILSETLGDTPYVVTLAPVCRPQWLIEMECIAIRTID